MSVLKDASLLVKEMSKVLEPVAKKIGHGGKYLFEKAIVESKVTATIHKVWAWTYGITAAILILAGIILALNFGYWFFGISLLSIIFIYLMIYEITLVFDYSINPEYNAFCFLMNRLEGLNDRDEDN